MWEVRPHSYQRGLNDGRRPAGMPSNTDTLYMEKALCQAWAVSAM